jgi:hypothetical protein
MNCQDLRNHDYIGAECGGAKLQKDPAYMVNGKYGGRGDNATIKYCQPTAGQTSHGTGYNQPISQSDYVACPAPTPTILAAPISTVKVLPHVGSDASLLLALVMAIAVGIFTAVISKRRKYEQ